MVRNVKPREANASGRRTETESVVANSINADTEVSADLLRGSGAPSAAKLALHSAKLQMENLQLSENMHRHMRAYERVNTNTYVCLHMILEKGKIVECPFPTCHWEFIYVVAIYCTQFVYLFARSIRMCLMYMCWYVLICMWCTCALLCVKSVDV